MVRRKKRDSTRENHERGERGEKKPTVAHPDMLINSLTI